MPEHSRIEGATVLVTGGHGFIGRHVVNALHESGVRPISVIQPSTTPVKGIPGETVTADLTDPEQWVGLLKGVDSVVHLAARAGGIQFQQSSATDVFRSNRLLTDQLLAACATAGVERVFLASSLVTYRPSADQITESHQQLGPAERPDPYAWSKITDEVVAVWQPDIQVLIGRFGNVYGPGALFDSERSTVVHALIDRAARLTDGSELVVWGDGTAVRTFVYVEDAARAVVTILGAGSAGEAYNVDSGERVTIAELAETVQKHVNPSLSIDFDPSKPAGVPFRVASIAKLSGLGYSPAVDLDEGVRRTVGWYRDTQ